MTSQPRSTRWLPPTGISAADLKHELAVGVPTAVLDVRESAPFESGHLRDSVHAPDSNPSRLAKEIEKHARIVLVCDDGRLSAMVARTLKFSGLTDPLYLIGGLKQWTAEGGELFERTEKGIEKRVYRETAGEATRRGLLAVTRSLNARVFFAALAGAAGLLALAFQLTV
jgi:rhodanese-related sulfurtransferase